MIFRYYDLLCAGIALARAFARTAFYLRKSAYEDLALPPDTRLAPTFHKRFRHYCFGTTYLLVLFSSFRKKSYHRADLRKFALLSALSCHFDDLAEAFRKQRLAIQMIDAPENFDSDEPDVRLALHLLKNLYATLNDAQCTAVKRHLYALFYLEVHGLASGPQRSEIGSHSVLLFRYLLSWPISDAELSAWQQFGGFIQFCDDIFDLWQDHRDGVDTTPLRLAKEGRLFDLRQMFDADRQQIEFVFRAAAQFRPQHTTLACIQCLSGITDACLLRYAEIAKNHGKLPLSDRKTMVTDMGLWRNRWRALRRIV